MLAESKDPKFAHFKQPLHISIHVKGYGKEKCEERLEAAVAEIEKYMDPNSDPTIQPGKYNTVSKPVIRVGVPPTDSGYGGNALKARKDAPTYDAYAYTATFDGTYEGYPSTGPAETKDDTSSSRSRKQSEEEAPAIPRNPLKRALTPSSSSESSDDERGSSSPPPVRHELKKPAMTMGNMFRRAYDSEDDDDDDDEDD